MVCYADDLVLTINNEASIDHFFQEFEDYSRVSGAQINVNKTKIVPLGVWRNMDNTIVEKTTIAVKILGAWFTRDGIDSDLIWTDLIKKGTEKLKLFQDLEISIYTRAKIIKSVMFSTFRYFARVVRFKKEHYTEIKKITARFVWGKRYELLHRDVLFQDVKHGGI